MTADRALLAVPAGSPRGAGAFRSLARAFDPRRNSLNAIRLALASAVIVSHAWPIGGYGHDPIWGDQSLGGWAVAGFFTVSGYLITMSRERSRSFVDFLWRRFLRIYPGYLVVLLFGAFVVAPVAVMAFGDSYAIRDAGVYLLRNLGLWQLSGQIPGVFTTNPFGPAVNGSLWTLFYEFGCYLAVGLLVTVVPARGRGPVTIAVFVLGSLASGIVVIGGIELPTTIEHFARLGTYFAAGALMYLYRERIPFSPWLTAIAALLTFVAMGTSTFQVFAGLPVAYLLMSMSVWLPLHRIGAKNDISYGMYIYAFPLQQFLAAALPDQVLPVWAFALACVAITVPFSWASWRLVERPAMRLKRLTARRPVDVAPAKDGLDAGS